MKFKRILSLFTVVVMILALNTSAFATEVYKFTVQPKGGEASNNQPFTFTWETNVKCNYLLQSRDGESYDWGNIDWIESPYSVEMADYTAQFRIMATDIDNDIEFYSDIFTITWKPAKDSTNVSMSSAEFADVLLGYDDVETLPITVTNTGAYELRKPTVFMGDGSDQYFEIVQNGEPHNLLPGESDSITWSIRPKKGLDIGHYHELFYLSAENIAEYASATCDLQVNESAVELTYSMDANNIDFGTHEEGYGSIDGITLTVRATGTGNLTKVHIKTDGSDKSFFTLKQNQPETENLAAGTDTGSNWYVYLNNGLKPGDYSTYISVYAAEITEPVKVKISAKITAKPFSESSAVSYEISSAESAEEASTAVSGNSSEKVTETDSSASSHIGGLTSTHKKNYIWLAISIGAAVIIIASIILVTVKLKKSKVRMQNSGAAINETAGGAGFGVTFDGNAGCSGGDTVDSDGTAYGTDGFNAEAGYGYTDGSFGIGDNTGYTGDNGQSGFFN